MLAHSNLEPASEAMNDINRLKIDITDYMRIRTSILNEIMLSFFPYTIIINTSGWKSLRIQGALRGYTECALIGRSQ